MARERVRYGVVALSICMTGLCTTGFAADPPAATQPARRSMQAIVQDIQTNSAALSGLNPATLGDEATRKEIAPKVLPVLKKLAGYADEVISQDEPQAKQQGQMMKGQIMSLRVILGDQDAAGQLEQQTKSANASEALSAKSDLMTAHWLLANKDAAAQTKLAGEAASLAKDNPTDDHLTVSLMSMTQMGAANPDLTLKIEDLILGMKSQTASQMGPMIEGRRKLAGLENKPLVIKGAKNGGGEFSTADWKGKVILVDFWATWCGPCLGELPRVKKAYSTWHDKGLEVLGVSCDNSGDDLTKFLASNPDMPWPQLFDPKTAGWHPIATGFGITGIPTMFLIDKKGVVRTVEARENFEELIPKMLDEK